MTIEKIEIERNDCARSPFAFMEGARRGEDNSHHIVVIFSDVKDQYKFMEALKNMEFEVNNAKMLTWSK